MSKRFGSGLFLGAMVGTAVGKTMGLLFAKKRGSDLRKQMMKAADEGKTPLEVFIKELSAVVKDEYKAAKKFIDSEEVHDVIEGGKERLESMTHDIREQGLEKMKQTQAKLLELAELAKSKAMEIKGKYEEELKKVKDEGHDHKDSKDHKSKEKHTKSEDEDKE